MQIIRVRPQYFELGYSEFPVISNSKPFPFPLDLPLSHLLAAISNSRYFELVFVSQRVRNSGIKLYFDCFDCTPFKLESSPDPLLLLLDFCCLLYRVPSLSTDRKDGELWLEDQANTQRVELKTHISIYYTFL